MDYSYFNAGPAQPQPYLIGLPNSHGSTPQSDSFGNIPHSADHFDYDYAFSPSFPLPFEVALPHSPPESFSRKSDDLLREDVKRNRSRDHGEEPTVERNPGRSSSDEKESFTPAQNRRKAQNRAAQRAFRERKERHVRELEQKLNELEEASNTLSVDNERLKRELAKIVTENEILRATSTSRVPSVDGGEETPGHEATVTASSLKFVPPDLYHSVEGQPPGRPFSPRIAADKETGERLLDASAMWDLIQSHPLSKQGLVDLGDVCERLKGHARCDGHGPVYAESQVQKAIEASVAGGNDELI